VDTQLKKYQEEHTKLLQEQKLRQKTIGEFEKELTSLSERIETNLKKIDKKREEMSKKRQNYYQQQIDESKKIVEESGPKEKENLPKINPCREELTACNRLTPYLRDITGEKKQKKYVTNGKKTKSTTANADPEPEPAEQGEELPEEPPKPNDEDPLTHHYLMILAFEKISVHVPITVGHARELIPVVKEREVFFTKLAFPDRNPKKSKNAQNGDGRLAEGEPEREGEGQAEGEVEGGAEEEPVREDEGEAEGEIVEDATPAPAEGETEEDRTADAEEETFVPVEVEAEPEDEDVPTAGEADDVVVTADAEEDATPTDDQIADAEEEQTVDVAAEVEEDTVEDNPAEEDQFAEGDGEEGALEQVGEGAGEEDQDNNFDLTFGEPVKED